MHTTGRPRRLSPRNRIGAIPPVSNTMRRQLGALTNSSAIASAVEIVLLSLGLAKLHAGFLAGTGFGRTVVSTITLAKLGGLRGRRCASPPDRLAWIGAVRRSSPTLVPARHHVDDLVEPRLEEIVLKVFEVQYYYIEDYQDLDKLRSRYYRGDWLSDRHSFCDRTKRDRQIENALAARRPAGSGDAAG